MVSKVILVTISMMAFILTMLCRSIDELDIIANRVLDAGKDLESDHPGFNDPGRELILFNTDCCSLLIAVASSSVSSSKIRTC
jgi:hypothetical protein